jgi:hypothetical protein
MHLYCVDGTNVVRVLWGYGGAAFREQEERDCATLVESFATLCRGLDDPLEVDIFFDGEGRCWPRSQRLPANLRVRFAWEEPADSIILDRVRAQAYSPRSPLGQAKGSVTVVTADGELGRRARAEGGDWLGLRAGEDLVRILRSIERRFTRR